MNKCTQIPQCHFQIRIPCSHRGHVETQDDVNLKYKSKTSYSLNCKALCTIHMCIIAQILQPYLSEQYRTPLR
jgi:hypothetical protein